MMMFRSHFEFWRDFGFWFRNTNQANCHCRIGRITLKEQA